MMYMKILSMEERNIALDVIDVFMANNFAEVYRASTNTTMWDWYQDTRIDGIQYTDGATKCVFFAEELEDWVIKCKLPCETRDYCTREYENYRAAVEAGFDYYFAAVEYLCEREGILFYVQERVECDEDVDELICEKLQLDYEESGTPYERDSLWDEVSDMDSYSRVHLLYGDLNLADFIWSRHINDLHCANFGTIGDHYVMIDFSGFGMSVWSK